MMVPMEGLTNRQARAVIRESEDRLRGLEAERMESSRPLIPTSAEPAAPVRTPHRRRPMTVNATELTGAEVNALVMLVDQALAMGHRFPWKRWQRERARVAATKLRSGRVADADS